MLTFFTGKMGAGKTTYAKELSQKTNAVYLSEDDVLSSLFREEIQNLKDYATYSQRIKPLVKSLVKNYLERNIDVVMDFPGNDPHQRAWFKELITEIDCTHQLIYIKASDETCLKQIKKRSIEQPERQAFDNEEFFRKVNKYFQEPTIKEGFNIQIKNEKRG